MVNTDLPETPAVPFPAIPLHISQRGLDNLETDTDQNHFFSPNLVIQDSDLMLIADGLYDTAYQGTVRRRDYLQNIRDTIRVVVANLVAMTLSGADTLVLPIRQMDGLGRYKPTKLIARRVREALNSLSDIEAIHVTKGGDRCLKTIDQYGNERVVQAATRVSLSPDLRSVFERYSTEAIGPRTDKETIILKRRDSGFLGGRLRSTSSYVGYNETVQTKLFRSQLQTINTHTTKHPVQYTGSKAVPKHSDAYERVFCNGTFEEGGRLFGHWAQSLEKNERRFMRIDGEPVVDLDFRSMHIVLLHVDDGTPVPPGDPFMVPGHEHHRDLVKRGSYCFLNAAGDLKQCPDGLRDELPTDLQWKQLRSLILKHVPLIEKYLRSQIGLRLMRTESDILIDVLLELVAHDIGFVPLHDGLLVPQSKHDLVYDLMLRRFRQHAGDNVEIKSHFWSFG